MNYVMFLYIILLIAKSIAINCFQKKQQMMTKNVNVDAIFIPPLPEGGGGYTVLPLSVLPSVQDIFRRIFLSNC